MWSLVNKKRVTLAVDLSNDAITRIVIVASDGERYYLEGYETYWEESQEGMNFLQGFKPEAISIILGDGHALCFAVPNWDIRQLELEKRKRGLQEAHQYVDFLTVGATGLLAAVRQTTVSEVLASVQETFPRIPTTVVNHAVATLMGIYLRSYQPQPELRTAILHCTGRFITLLVMHTEMPVWTGTVEIPTHPENEDNGSMLYSEISALLQTANEKLSQSHYDLLLLAGDCDAEDLRALRGFAARAELLNPWQQRAVEISPRMMGRQMALTTDGHRWAAALGGATMLLENTGMNLATTTVNLNREFPLLRPVQHQQTVSRAIQQAGQWLGSAGWSLVRQQRYILAASLLISLFAIGYRYYNISNQLADLDSALQRETQRALVVADVQAKYDAYSKKTHQIQAQITAINAIRQKQLTVGTVLQEIDKRVPAGLVFGNVEIRETTVKIKGYAPERAAVFTFANRLGQSFGVFGDVVPVYDDKTNVGNYEIQCRYLGPIPTNELPTPRAAAALDPGLSLIKPSN